jgi:hypothetical protein
MLFIKSSVRIAGMRPEILLAAVVAERVYEKAGYDCTITSCVDGQHMAGSLHYKGAAIDLRTKQVAHAIELKQIVDPIKECLGADFDVVVETDHLHIEFDPKQSVTNG